ncbi:MAG: hypothetical protein HY392_02385 [Candidatus Diapherotrites archaeon]|nr:hypothetical protein [Candidatus Diapherotrites archaeon]
MPLRNVRKWSRYLQRSLSHAGLRYRRAYKKISTLPEDKRKEAENNLRRAIQRSEGSMKHGPTGKGGRIIVPRHQLQLLHRIIADTALRNSGVKEKEEWIPAKEFISAKDYSRVKRALEKYIESIPKIDYMIQKAKKRWGSRVPKEERTRINRYFSDNFLKNEEIIRELCGQELANSVLNEVEQLKRIIRDWVD